MRPHPERAQGADQVSGFSRFLRTNSWRVFLVVRPVLFKVLIPSVGGVQMCARRRLHTGQIDGLG